MCQALDDALRTNWLERTVDSDAWPYAADAAASARFRVTAAQPGQPDGKATVKESTAPARWVAEV